MFVGSGDRIFTCDVMQRSMIDFQLACDIISILRASSALVTVMRKRSLVRVSVRVHVCTLTRRKERFLITKLHK